MRPRLERTTPYPSAPNGGGGPVASAPPPSVGSRLGSDPLSIVRSLTARDRFVVSVLAEHQVLTTAQLAQLCFGRLDLAQRRLLRLVRLGVLDRFRWHALVGSEAWHYTLGPAGAAIDAAGRGVESPRPAELRRRALRLAASPRLAHLLGVNGFFCALAQAARHQPGSALVSWRSERRCAELYGTLVRPDAAGIYQEGGQRVGFFLTGSPSQCSSERTYSCSWARRHGRSSAGPARLSQCTRLSRGGTGITRRAEPGLPTNERYVRGLACTDCSSRR